MELLIHYNMIRSEIEPFDEENILLITNSERDSGLLSILREADYSIHFAENKESAFHYINKNKPWLIIINANLPWIDGYELCRLIKADELNAHIPIIIICETDEENSKIKVFESRADDYLNKPFIKEEILARVKTHISISRMRFKMKENEAHKMEDKSEREKAEILLKQSEENFRAIFENNSAAIAIIEQDTTISMVNDAYCQMGGYSKEEVIGMSWTEQIPPEDLERLKEYNLKRLTNTGDAPDKYEFTFYKRDGEIRHGILSVSLNQTNKKIITSFIDITERKRAEEALKESEEKFRLLLNSTGEAIYGLNVNGNCTFCNKAALRMLKYENEKDLIGKNMHNLIHHTNCDGSGLPVEECRIYKAFIEGEGTHVDDEILWRSDGIYFPAEYWSYPIYREGIIIGSVVTFVDITDRKQTELKLKQYTEELKELNKTKDRLFSIIAHDLKTPFQGLLGYTKILATEYSSLSEEEKISFITSIEDLSNNAYKLLENLLEWTRLQTGKNTFNPENFNLFLELYPTISIVKQTAGKKEIQLNCDIDNSIFIQADKNMVSTIVRNLVSNSVKFTNPGGTIKLAATKYDNFVEISVEDNGVGINKETLEELFKFDKTITTKGTANEGGTGLGLLLCKELVEKHGGEIRVESEVNKGSRFVLTIPSAH